MNTATAMIPRRRPGGRIAYVDGRYLPHANASVHIEDRGLQFSDSIYEVVGVSEGALLDEEAHLDRLERSLASLAMQPPMGRGSLRAVLREMLRRNRLKDGLIYLQVTRGAHRRDHPIPARAQPTLIITARFTNPVPMEKRREEGISVILLPDIRWGRRDIKATALLPNVLAKTEARKNGAFEAWLVDSDGLVTEGASTNAWIVTSDNVLVTRHLSENILAGVTRGAVLRALGSEIAVEERAFTPAEAFLAREAFITSATGGVLPVVKIDSKSVGNGRPGPTAKRLQGLYRELAYREAWLFSSQLQ
jgi:D-alanine transaminase